MAMEWGRNDVLRVMKENVDANGKVDMPAVRTSFNISTDRKSTHFDLCLIGLEEEALIHRQGETTWVR